jgi:hypothetical protein
MKTSKKGVREYMAFLEADEHGGYTVTVPTLLGLVAEGEDLNHARAIPRMLSAATSKA